MPAFANNISKTAAYLFGKKIAADVANNKPAPQSAYFHPSQTKDFVPPTDAQVAALKSRILAQGFHPSVADEHASSARYFGLPQAMKEFDKTKALYPANNGVPGTSAVSSREYYFNQQNNAYRGLYGATFPAPGDPKYRPGHRVAAPEYPAHMKAIQQTGTTQPLAPNGKPWTQPEIGSARRDRSGNIIWGH